MRKAVLSVLLTVALGATYIWLGILGERPLAKYINASVTIPDSHGLLVGTSVRVRGFKIGEVTALQRSSEGVRIEFKLDGSHRVPLSSRLKVESLTALETYLDFMPPNLEKPYIEDGAVISAARTSVPITVPEVFALLN